MAISPLRDILNERAKKFEKGAKILSEPHITDSDPDFIINFLRMVDASLSEAGQ